MEGLPPLIVQKYNKKLYICTFAVFYQNNTSHHHKAHTSGLPIGQTQEFGESLCMKGEPTPFIQTNCFHFFFITGLNNRIRQASWLFTFLQFTLNSLR